MKPLRLAAVGVAAALAGGCGTTRIVTTERSARIYVDGELKGRGQAEIAKRGAPQSARIVVKAPDGRKAEQQVSREFTVETFFAGLFSYGVGFLTAWEYPDTLFVPLDEKKALDWDAADDVWLKPPPGWAPPAPSR